MLYNTFSPFCARLRASARVRTYEGWAGPGQLRSALFSTMSMVENSASAGGRRPALRAAGPRAHTRCSAWGPASLALFSTVRVHWVVSLSWQHALHEGEAGVCEYMYTTLCLRSQVASPVYTGRWPPSAHLPTQSTTAPPSIHTH